MLKIGIAGYGFMGRMHHRCWRGVGEAAVVAVCDADRRAIDDAASRRGNIAGAAEDIDLTGVAVYDDFQAMIRSERLDAVSITVPTDQHAALALAALAAGVHVLCEKPMALDLDAADAMIAAAERHDRVLQIGHCIRFWPEYAMAKELVASGRYGRVLAASFVRLAATAITKPASWFLDQQRSGGIALDLHIHDTDFIQYLFGMPRAVSSRAAALAGGPMAHIATHYAYDDILVSAEAGWAMMPSFGFDMHFHLVLEQASIVFNYHATPSLTVHPAQGEALAPPCASGDGYAHEIAHFARAIRGEPVTPIVTPRDARRSLAIALAERESAATGREVPMNIAGQEDRHER